MFVKSRRRFDSIGVSYFFIYIDEKRKKTQDKLQNSLLDHFLANFIEINWA